MRMETSQALIQVNKGQRLRGYKVKSANELKNLGNQELATQMQMYTGQGDVLACLLHTGRRT